MRVATSLRLAGRQREDCAAWFWCKDADGQPCFDLQSGSWVNWHGCKLMDVPLLPADSFDPSDMTPTSDAAYFRNFATGYVKRALVSPRAGCLPDSPVQRTS